jgi:uncharacterized membrane protein/protein-disulfide isomerase
MTRTRRALLIVLALLGLIAASTSSYVHYRLLNDPGYASFCDVNPTVSCTQAYLSPYGSLFGVPVALAGVLFFSVVIAVVALGPGERSPRRASAAAGLLALATIGLGFAIYLAWASYVVLHSFCILCALTYVAVVGVFLTALAPPRPPLAAMPREIGRALAALAGTPLSLLFLLGVLVGGGLLVSLFPSDRGTATAAAETVYPSLTDQQRDDLRKWWTVQPTVDLPIPADGASVVVVKFSDFMCPGCRQSYEWYKPIIAKYVATGRVRYVVEHYPLEGECNPHAPSNHYASCEAAAAVIMARATGKADALEQWIFANQTSLTPATVKAAAQEIGGIQDFDAQYQRALVEVTNDANLGGTLGVDRTPTFYIAGRKVPNESLLPPPYFSYLIELALGAGG